MHLLTVILLVATTTDGGEKVIGQWFTAGERARVEIFERDGRYHGRIAWLEDEEDGEIRLDINNPDPANRDRRIVGLEILRGFEYRDDGSFTGGRIYDPESGRTYRARMTLRDENTLEVRGFVGIAAFGRTETWHRVP